MTIDEEYKKALSYYSYTQGTDYFLANCKNKLAPVVYDIKYDGTNFTFTPSEHLYDKLNKAYGTAPITDNSLLRGLTKIMSLVTMYCISYSVNHKWYKDEAPDNRFILKDNTNAVDVYINYTNNMMFPDDDNMDYSPLVDYIFPNSRYPRWSSGYNRETLPKELIKIDYNYNNLTLSKINRINSTKTVSVNDLYTSYLKVFEHDYLKKLLLNFKIKDLLDIPTKLVLYGVCDKFGKDKDKTGICAILYIEHKISLADYKKFKDICDEKLNKFLKPLNLNVGDIKSMTLERLEKEFNTFPKIYKLMIACGYLRDPRGGTFKSPAGHNYIQNYDLLNQHMIYHDEFGLWRWEAIKTYYPELFKGLKTVFDYYIKKQEEYKKQFQSEYDIKLDQYANLQMLDLTNSPREDIINNRKLIIKYVNNFIKDLDVIKVDNFKDLIDVFSMVNQGILDEVSKVYKKYYKNQIIEYRNLHPKAKKMELIFDNNIFTNHTIITDILTYEPFNVDFLPKEVQSILNQREFENIKESLNKFKLHFKTNAIFYVNGEELKWRKNSKNQYVYKIDDLEEAEKSFGFTYITDDGDTVLTWKKDIYEIITRAFNSSQPIPDIDDMKLIVNAILSSEIKLKLAWIKGLSYTEPYIIGPDIDFLYDNPNKKNPDYNKFGYNGEKTVDDIITNIKADEESAYQYRNVDYKVVCEYQDPLIIIENLKETNFYKIVSNKITK